MYPNFKGASFENPIGFGGKGAGVYPYQDPNQSPYLPVPFTMNNSTVHPGQQINQRPYINNNANNPSVPVSQAPPSAIRSTRGDDNPDSPYSDNRNVASQFGYTAAEPNLGISLVNAILPGPFKLDDPNYGRPGTYDRQGNIFANDGRSYSSVTGNPEGYRGFSDFYDTHFGPENNFSKMRSIDSDGDGKPDYDWVQSALGSPQMSIHPEIGGVTRYDHMRGINPGTQNHGLRNTRALLNYNTFGNPNSPFAGTSNAYMGEDGRMVDDFGNQVTVPEMSYELLQMDPNAIPNLPEELTGKIGYSTGDVFISPNDKGVSGNYVVGEDGSLRSTQGTMVSFTDPTTGEAVSTLSKQFDAEGNPYHTTAGSDKIIEDTLVGTDFDLGVSADADEIYNSSSLDGMFDTPTPSDYNTVSSPTEISLVDGSFASQANIDNFAPTEAGHYNFNPAYDLSTQPSNPYGNAFDGVPEVAPAAPPVVEDIASVPHQSYHEPDNNGSDDWSGNDAQVSSHDLGNNVSHDWGMHSAGGKIYASKGGYVNSVGGK